MKTTAALLATILAAAPALAFAQTQFQDTEVRDLADCDDGTSANLGAAVSSGAVVQLGGVQATIPASFLQVAASFDGHFWLDVEMDCALGYYLRAVRVDALGNRFVELETQRVPECVTGEHWHQLPTPVDTVQYELDLVWEGCDGDGGGDRTLATITDPPVTPLLRD